MLATDFGPLLRKWRTARQLSQERLATDAEVSARHISFMENGRSRPSREMVLVLASALDVPLRERNVMLAAAGFAAAYGESDLGSPAMGAVNRALDHILATQEPYGAAVLDRGWNVLRMNQGGIRMMLAFLDPAATPPIVLGNAMHAVFHPEGLRRYCAEWDVLAADVVRRLELEAMQPGNAHAGELLDALLAYPNVPRHVRTPSAGKMPGVLLPIHLVKEDIDVRLFTMITSLGTPLDVTAQEVRVESYFPADERTETWVRSLAS